MVAHLQASHYGLLTADLPREIHLSCLGLIGGEKITQHKNTTITTNAAHHISRVNC